MELEQLTGEFLFSFGREGGIKGICRCVRHEVAGWVGICTGDTCEVIGDQLLYHKDHLLYEETLMEEYENDFSDTRLHHEIYLSDARKVAPEKWKTVIRHPIKIR